jgi:hypothetical protein
LQSRREVALSMLQIKRSLLRCKNHASFTT